jgi:fatty-acyl-CoA synthase
VPLPEVELRIVGSDAVLGDREVGEILARAPSLMRGYMGPDAQDPFEDGWLRTGDLGYTVEGELFVTGRIKEIIISYGRNYHPEDIEWAAGRVPEVRPGRVVAFADSGDSDGKLVVAFEPAQEDELDGLLGRVRQAVADLTGLVPKAVVALPRGTIMRTTSGKLQRTRMRERWSRGELRDVALAVESPGEQLSRRGEQPEEAP